MILCYTTLIIDILHEVDEAILFAQSQKSETLLISVVNEWEVLQGARNKKEYKAFQKALKRYNIIELDETISSHAGILLETYQLSQGVAIPDALIAATSVKYRIPLKTANIKDFRYIKGIKLDGIMVNSTCFNPLSPTTFDRPDKGKYKRDRRVGQQKTNHDAEQISQAFQLRSLCPCIIPQQVATAGHEESYDDYEKCPKEVILAKKTLVDNEA